MAVAAPDLLRLSCSSPAEIHEMPGRVAGRLVHTGDPLLPVGESRVDVEAHTGFRRNRVAGPVQHSRGKFGNALDASGAVGGPFNRAPGPSLAACTVAVDLAGGRLLGGTEGFLL